MRSFPEQRLVIEPTAMSGGLATKGFVIDRVLSTSTMFEQQRVLLGLMVMWIIRLVLVSVRRFSVLKHW